MLATERLSLRHLEETDAEFILRLLNEEDFLRYIGDRNVRTLADARDYINDGPRASYARFGFGLFLVELLADATPIGMCGLIKRDVLDDVDIGFAFLKSFRTQGYALEAAQATLIHARDTLKIPKVVAIVSPDNMASIRLLQKIGMRFDRAIDMPGSGQATHLFAPV